MRTIVVAIALLTGLPVVVMAGPPMAVGIVSSGTFDANRIYSAVFTASGAIDDEGNLIDVSILTGAGGPHHKRNGHLLTANTSRSRLMAIMSPVRTYCPLGARRRRPSRRAQCSARKPATGGCCPAPGSTPPCKGPVRGQLG